MRRGIQVTIIIAALWVMVSVSLSWPYQLSYFNEGAGGTRDGHKHMLGSSFDWGHADVVAIRHAESVFTSHEITTIPPLSRQYPKASKSGERKPTGRVFVFSRSTYAALDSPDWNAHAELRLIRDSLASHRPVVSLTVLHDAIDVGER